MRIFQADITDAVHRQHIQSLFEEYLYWANGRLQEAFGIQFDIPEMIAGDMETLDKFAPPKGRLLLSAEGNAVTGLACMRQIRPDVAEIKRMFVRPAYRRQGVGRALVEAAVSEAREAGYDAVYLDSARFMKGAHALYQSCGFQPIAPYPESEIPPEFRGNWVFMRLPLHP